MYKILLLTDFSAAAQHAILFTQALFAGTEANFCLLHAFPFVPEEGYSGSFLLGEQLESAEKSIQAQKRSLIQPSAPTNHTYRTKVALGSPERVIEVVLAEEHFDLIVVGATGAGRNEFFGSVATGMIRTASANVLVVPTTAYIHPITHIVLATDYRSVNNAESFSLLKDLTSRKAAKLTVLSIENPQAGKAVSSEVSRRYVLDALKDLQPTTYTLQDDDPRLGINTYLETHSVDLLVLLPHHKGLWDIISHNSVTRAMAFHPLVPLLTLYDDAAPAGQSIPSAASDEIPFSSYL
ncbi:universal stress protein [Spirosoma litoris]